MATSRFAEPIQQTAGGVRAFLVREAINYRRYWKTTVVVSTITPLFYVLSLGLGLGTVIDSRGGVGELGISYLAYLAPALVAATAMQVAANEATFPVMSGFTWEKQYFAMHATPLTPGQILRGSISWLSIRVFSACAVFFGIIACFGAVKTWQSLATVPIATFGAVAFVAPIFALSATIKKDGAFNYIFRFVVTPMMLFSGTFYEISSLPKWGQVLAWVTPLWHTNELARGAALGPLELSSGIGHLSLTQAVVHLAYLALWLIVGFALSQRQFRRRLIV